MQGAHLGEAARRADGLASFLPTGVTGTGCCLSRQVEKSCQARLFLTASRHVKNN